ncbi:hypothetical protein JCM10908_002817 [Rhodotorula pacifica]|uniref:uncharacterized protein n=1 Tax=Rhodotorula pacifica TaxID=1495444 RepID=UPI003170E011
MTSSSYTTEQGDYTVAPAGPCLSYSLHHPTTAIQNAVSKAAIIAHPYGRLGGCKEDHVVVALAGMLASGGWTVLTYDARGSGSSTGSVSWSSRAEAKDYESMLREVLLPAVLPPAAAGDVKPQKVSLLLAGYSYGSLAASACPPPAETADVCYETSYLLVSYPLSVVWALCALQTSYFVSALDKHSQTHCVLAVNGDQDQFTAVEKFRSWSTGLADSDRFQAVEITGADHFWRQRDKKAALLSAIHNWIT